MKFRIFFNSLLPKAVHRHQAVSKQNQVT
ncbi:uncharacterized protein METZ01_LOCUS284233 [marine metagenome]|uniref:Uncharacterized protein n=1 Tax=marine metagenome TaxID=408172 RepID=A0A382L441_9ZZZZ